MHQMNLLNGVEITNGITTGVDVRRQRGLEIAAVARIELKDGAPRPLSKQSNEVSR